MAMHERHTDTMYLSVAEVILKENSSRFVHVLCAYASTKYMQRRPLSAKNETVRQNPLTDYKAITLRLQLKGNAVIFELC